MATVKAIQDGAYVRGGKSISFKKGETLDVPFIVAKELREAGIVPPVPVAKEVEVKAVVDAAKVKAAALEVENAKLKAELAKAKSSHATANDEAARLALDLEKVTAERDALKAELAKLKK